MEKIFEDENFSLRARNANFPKEYIYIRIYRELCRMKLRKASGEQEEYGARSIRPCVLRILDWSSVLHHRRTHFKGQKICITVNSDATSNCFWTFLLGLSLLFHFHILIESVTMRTKHTFMHHERNSHVEKLCFYCLTTFFLSLHRNPLSSSSTSFHIFNFFPPPKLSESFFFHFLTLYRRNFFSKYYFSDSFYVNESLKAVLSHSFLLGSASSACSARFFSRLQRERERWMKDYLTRTFMKIKLKLIHLFTIFSSFSYFFIFIQYLQPSGSR